MVFITIVVIYLVFSFNITYKISLISKVILLFTLFTPYCAHGFYVVCLYFCSNIRILFKVVWVVCAGVFLGCCFFFLVTISIQTSLASLGSLHSGCRLVFLFKLISLITFVLRRILNLKT